MQINPSEKPLRKLSKDGSLHVTDEVYNTLISATGALLALLGAISLVYLSVKNRKPWHIAGFTVYGTALFQLFLSSALHHGIDGSEKTEHGLRQLDYYAIFVMIAGSFTPLCLILLRNTLGWSVLALVWFLSILGILLKMLYPSLPKWFSTTLYIGMGWLGLLIAKPVYLLVPQVIFGLMIGGFFYTVGALLFFLERPNPFPGKFGFHEIWHLFVLAGATSHFCIMYFYLLPFPS
ncbi:MAG: hemolysin III family protein [Deltaproteobacteria bacterium]|nr:hemolysin III family protein [Deltaproteobacteria bacterium]